MTATAPPRSGRARAGAVPADSSLRAALLPLLASAAARSRPTLAAALLPVEPVDPLALFRVAQERGVDASLWIEPDDGVALVGVGDAWSMSAEGHGRSDAIDAAWSQLCAEAVLSPYPAAPPRACGPVLLGGLGFGDAVASDPTWRGFEQAIVTLPTFLLTSTATGSWVTMSRLVSADEAAEPIAHELATAWQAFARAAAGSPRQDPDPGGVLRVVPRRPDAAMWRASVARLAGAVGRGRIDKAVLARSVELAASGPIDIGAVLDRLRRSAPESTLFAFGRAGRVFLGATPERLVRLQETRFRTMAMAGSAPRTGEPARDAQLAAALLGSDKEREEHEVVVAMLRQTLTPLAARLEVPAAPHVEPFRHVQHLVTPVEGTLREPASLLRLAALLHPTPAVGGTPRELAIGLAAEEEAQQRGWYAGPVGWVDAQGDGELMVALRSGVVEGSRATLFAGCGIMADSDPEHEWEESEAKLRGLWSALEGTEG